MSSYDKIELCKRIMYDLGCIEWTRCKMREVSQIIDLTLNKKLQYYFDQFLQVREPEDNHQMCSLKIKLHKFYNMLKIHKNPVQVQPIAPCHSAPKIIDIILLLNLKLTL